MHFRCHLTLAFFYPAVLLIKCVGIHRRAALSGVMRGAVAGEHVKTEVHSGIAPH